MIRYFWYLLKHKYYVFIECCKLGIPIRGLLHDLSKFLPSECIPFIKYHYKNHSDTIRRDIRDKTGYYNPLRTNDPDLIFAWYLHVKRNDHHWQHWTIVNDDGSFKTLKADRSALKEMLADWIGASKVQNKNSPLKWYIKNKNKIYLHISDRKWIEHQLYKKFVE